MNINNKDIQEGMILDFGRQGPFFVSYVRHMDDCTIVEGTYTDCPSIAYWAHARATEIYYDDETVKLYEKED